MKKVYTEEQKEFFRNFIPGHTTAEVVAEFNRRFEQKTTISKVKAYKVNNHIKSGKMKRRILLVVSILLVFIGLAMLIAPRVSNQVGKQIAHSSQSDRQDALDHPCRRSRQNPFEYRNKMPKDRLSRNCEARKGKSGN